MVKKKITYLILLFFVLLHGEAQVPYPLPLHDAILLRPGYIDTLSTTQVRQVYNFEQFTVDQGLSQSEVNDVFEDSRGFIWFATQGGGVCRFDGVNFIQYDEQQGLAGNIVNCIAEDKKGNMWFGSTWGGMSMYNGKTFKLYDTENGLPTNSINKLLVDKQSGNLLIGTDDGLTVFDHNQFTTIKSFAGVNDVMVSALFQMENGTVLIGTNKGLFAKSGEQFKLIEGSKGVAVFDVCADATTIWVAANTVLRFNVSDYSLRAEEAWDQVARIKFADVKSVHYAGNSQLWFGTDEHGVFLLRYNSLYHFDNTCGYVDKTAKKIYTDRSGRTWFGTRGSGTIRFNGFTFNYFNSVEGLNSADIFSIVQDNDRNIWVASMTQGLYRYDGKTVRHYSTRDGLPSDAVRHGIKSKDGTLWFASRSGLIKFDGSRFSFYTEKDGLPVDNLRCLMEDREGVLWIGTSGGGLVSYDRKKFTVYNEDEGLNHGFVHSLLEDSKGNIWIGTGAGLNKFSDGTFTAYGEEEGLCNTYVGNIAEDRFGNIWVGTDKCISSFNGRKFTNYDVSDGLSSGTVFLMVFDSKGNLIVGTNKGIDKIKFTAYGQISSIRNYSKGEGFTGIECNSKSVLTDVDNNIWIGTVKGVIKYNPEEDIENIHPPSAHISSVKMFYDEKWTKSIEQNELNWFGLPKHYDFRYDQNMISFGFTGICTAYPERLQYSYYLQGFDKQWSPLAKTSTASYSNLSPGDYVFYVKAKSANGLWSEQSTFSFTILPAFWQTWWFACIILGVFIYVIFYINGIMQRNVMRHNELLEEKVNYRTQEILKQKEEKEILLKEIHHRVKNNMQVIVSLLNIHSEYIKDQESLALIEDSKSRIRSMALIHEKLYESRNFSKINIGEYLDSLVKDLVDTYGIDTKIQIEKKIETDSFGFDTIIPLGLLLNEIVSNSLKYAFPNKKEGKIFFYLKEAGEQFVLEIGDDGIGMNREQFDAPGKTLGIDLIRILTEQLNGTIELLNQPGTRYLIRFESIDKKRI